MPQVTYLEAIRQGIWEEMERDPSVFCIGEDIGVYGGAFKVTDGFINHFGPERVAGHLEPTGKECTIIFTGELSRCQTPPC